MTDPQRPQPPRRSIVEEYVQDLLYSPLDTSQNQDPNYTNYSQNPQPTPYYSQNPQPLPYFGQDLNYTPQNQNPPYYSQGPHPSVQGSTSSAQYTTSSAPFTISPHTLPPRYPTTTSTTTTSPDVSSPPSPEIQAAPSDLQTGPSEKRKRRNPTPTYDAGWWRFYEMTKDADGVLKSARCKVKNCLTSYNYVKANGTSTFKKHVDKHLKRNEEPQEQADNSLVQTLIRSDGTRTHQKYDEKRMLSEFARYIAHKEQPISMGNCLSFARLIIRGCGEPMYKRFNHRKVVKELKYQYMDRKNELLAQFALANYKVSITSDIWTAGKHGLGYSCITAHYIDDAWVLQKRVISFRVLDSPHTAQIIYQSIINVLHEYNLKRDLENKIFSISFDNASNNIKSIDYFTRSLNPIMNGLMFHQKCACHILNLTVKAGLKTDVVRALIAKFKQGLAHIFSNQVRRQDFNALCVRLGLGKLRVPWDLDTRWNSTYRMFHRTLRYRQPIDETLRNSTEGLDLLLSEGEWNQIVNLKKFLECFFNATVKLSCSYTPSAHELLHHLYKISKVYSEMEGIQNSSLNPIVGAMKDKFLKYWEEVPLVTIIANCLHPAFKKRYTIKMLQRYKQNLNLDSTKEEARVNSALEDMFNLYNSRRTDQPSSSHDVRYEYNYTCIINFYYL